MTGGFIDIVDIWRSKMTDQELIETARIWLTEHFRAAKIKIGTEHIDRLIVLASTGAAVQPGWVANASRYEFLRDDDNWTDDGDQWLILGESSFSQFDQIVDEQMSRAATRKMVEGQKP